MTHTLPVLLATARSGKGKWPKILCLVFLLTACGRDAIPPSPADPVRPRMMSVDKSLQKPDAALVQKTIFTYTRQSRTPASSLMPEAADSKCCRLQV